MRISFAVKVAGLAALLALAALALFAYLSFRQHSAMIVDAIREELAATVRNSAAAFPADKVASYPGDALSLQGELDRLAARNPRDNGFRLFAMVDGKAALLASSRVAASPGTEDDYTRQSEERIRTALAQCVSAGETCVTPLYDDRGGHWVTAFAPIVDSQGRVAGILAADREAVEHRSAIDATLRQIAWYSALALAVAATLGTYLSLRVTRRLRSLYAAVLATRTTGFRPVTVSGADEVAALMHNFNETGLALQAKIEELAALNRELEERVEARTRELSGSLYEIRRRQDVIEREMATARRVQETIIPKSLNRERISISVEYIPISEIGGDLGFVAERSPSRYDVAVGDVTGHGVGAALVGNRVHMLLASLYGSGAPLDSILHRLDYFLSREVADIGMFLTIEACRFDLEEMTMSCASGGHVPALHYRAADGGVKEVEGRCGIVGAGELFCDPVPVQTVGIARGDYVLFYTDGLMEAVSESGEEFGRERLASTLAKAVSSPCDSKKAASCIVDAAKDFTGGRFQDDVLVIVVQIT